MKLVGEFFCDYRRCYPAVVKNQDRRAVVITANQQLGNRLLYCLRGFLL